jgi:hypothetical protein
VRVRGQCVAALPFASLLATLLATSFIVACARTGRATVTSGGMTWEVVDGAWGTDGDTLIGSGGHIETRAEYSDATIEVDVEQYADSGDRNVGIGFRCAATAYDPRKTDGYEVDWNSRKRMTVSVSTASVSKPLHRGWVAAAMLQPLKNHVVVRARGNTFVVEMNGVTVERYSDDEYARGHLRLWVESTGQAARFAHVRITPG